MSIRLNPNLLPDLLTAVQQSEQNMNAATEQLASGRSVNRLSDDPAAGTALKTQPFALNTTTNAVTYSGDANTTSVQLSNGNPISTSVPGSQLFQNASGDAFGALQNLNAALLSGNNIGAAVIQVQTALSTVSTQRVFYGNGLNQS